MSAAATTKVLTKVSLPTKFYQLLVKSAEPFVPNKLQPLWNHPAGKYGNFGGAVNKAIIQCQLL